MQKEIQAYDLFSFSQALQEAVQDGYSIKDGTAGYPQLIGNVFIATVYKEAVEEPVAPVKRKQKASTDE